MFELIARAWKARCPKRHEEGFIKYLYETGIKDTSATKGFQGAQIFQRTVKDESEITLITYWDNMESIKDYAGEDIGVAVLYPEDVKYELNPDYHVNHYEVIENTWLC